MYQLTTENRTPFEQVAARYAQERILDRLESPFLMEERDPLVLDGYGYNRTYIDVALDPSEHLYAVPMFLAWFEYNRERLSDYIPAFDYACEMYLEGKWYDGEWFAPFESIFTEHEYPAYRDISESFFKNYGEDNWVCRFLHTLVLEDMSDILEAMDRLDGMAFDHLKDMTRLTFIETNFNSYDPYEESDPELKFQAVDKLLGHQERMMTTWGQQYDDDWYSDAIYTHLVNPYKGGGFTCIS